MKGRQYLCSTMRSRPLSGGAWLNMLARRESSMDGLVRGTDLAARKAPVLAPKIIIPIKCLFTNTNWTPDWREESMSTRLALAMAMAVCLMGGAEGPPPGAPPPERERGTHRGPPHAA